MGQNFVARERFEFSNGAIGWAPGGPMDCLGPYAKVQNCPIHGTSLRLTCYATGYADTFFSVPACTRYRGKHIRGFFTVEDGSVGRSVVFMPMHTHRDLLPGKGFVVTMGQAFKDSLPAYLRQLGGTIWEVDKDDPTDVQVRVSFGKPRTAGDVQKQLWANWPSCWIKVERSRDE